MLKTISKKVNIIKDTNVKKNIFFKKFDMLILIVCL